MKDRNVYRFPYSRYPALRIVVIFTAGIVLSPYIPQYACISAFFLLLGVYYLLDRKRMGKNRLLRTRVSTWLYLMIILFGGAWRAQVTEKETPDHLLSLSQLDWEEIRVDGVILSARISSSGKRRVKISVEEVNLEGRELHVSFKASISIPKSDPAYPTAGDHIVASGKIMPIAEKRNPHDFDIKQYLQAQEILLQINADSVQLRSPPLPFLSWQHWRRKTQRVLDQNFSEHTSSIAKAMILGHKDDLHPEDRKAFSRVGLSHIMAVSGLHVGFVVAPFWLIIPWFWHSLKGRLSGMIVLISILFVYAGITGFPPSVLRASIMAGLLTAARLFNRNANSMNLMGVAALLILAADPGQLYNVGFQLSFSAVGVILITLPVLQSKIPHNLQYHWYAKPLMVVVVSIVVQFGLYPLQAWYFGEVSLISPLANALFVPLLGIIVPLAILALIAGMVWLPAGAVLNLPSEYYLRGMRYFVHLSSDWQWTWFESTTSGPMIFILWLALLMSIASAGIPKLRWKWLIIVLLLLNLTSVIKLFQAWSPPELEVLFFDVGQGDAALIRTPAGKHVLIDAGIWSPSYNSGRGTILPHLRAEGIKTLDAVVLSHPHADHIGGVTDILGGVNVRRIIRSGFEYDSRLWRRYSFLADSLQIPLQKAMPGDTLLIDPSVMMIIMGPQGEPLTKDPNQHSVIVKVIYGQRSVLFTGDSGEQQEEGLVHTYGWLLESDILKVGHHGSRTSSSDAFLELVKPDLSVISLGKDNRFGHPHSEAIHRLNQYSKEVTLTARDKAVLLRSDGKRIERLKWE